MKISFVAILAALALAAPVQAQYLSGALADRIESTSQQWGELGFDTCAHPTGAKGIPMRIKDHNYAHGLGHHANGEIVVELDGQYKMFDSDIGVQWQGGANVAAVIFQIFVDGREAFASDVMREVDGPRHVSIPVAGARELRLVAKAAAPGINCDCADWAEAGLTPDPSAPAVSLTPRLNIAPFAKVLSWDPKVMDGTKANRVEEMPRADIFPATELVPSPDGTWRAPVTNGAGSIGLQWEEDRPLRHVSIELQGSAPAPALQYWTGESEWQGKWQPVETPPEKADGALVWSLGFLRIPHGTQKVRWVFENITEPPVVRSMGAFTSSAEEPVTVHIIAARPVSAPVEITVYNGRLAQPGPNGPFRATWDTAKPLTLDLMAMAPQPVKADRTVLRFRFPQLAFGVAIEDLKTNDGVWVPRAGLFVTRNSSPSALDDYLKKIAGRRSVLDEVRDRPDQSFSNAWNVVHRSVEDLEPTMISLAADNRKYIVRRDGVVGFNEYDSGTAPALDPGNWNWLGTSQWQLLPKFGAGQNADLSRHLYGGWLPAPVTSVNENGVAYDETSFVAPVNGEKAVCGIIFDVKNNNDAAKDVQLSFQLKPGRDAGWKLDCRQTARGWVASHDGRIVAVVDGRSLGALTLSRAGDEWRVAGALSGGGKASCAVYLPGWKVAANESAQVLPRGSWLPRVEKYWNDRFATAMQVEIPDAHLENIIRASQVWCAVAARNDAKGAQTVPWIASAFYGPLESEANSIIRGMDMTGHADFARRSFDYFLGKCNAAGFITTGYTLVGTGELLWNIGECYDRDRDRAWLRANAPEIVRICQWIIRQREKTERLDVHGERVPEYGLMPPGVTADWDRFAYRFFNDAQYCAGLEWAGRALSEIGNPAAGKISDEARAYRSDILRAFHWTQARTPVNPLADGAWVPSDPSFLNCFGHIEDYYPTEDGGRGWCYSIEAGSHHLVANQILDPRSADARWMVNFLEDVQFLRDGWGGDYPPEKNRADSFDLGGFAKLQPYYCRIAEIYALRDDVKPFIRSYFNTIPSLVDGENLSFCEHFHNFGAWNKTHETGWFLCQTHDVFAMARGDELWLAPFVTSHWMENGMEVSARNVPTAFGKAGYDIVSDVAHGKITATVTLPRHCTAGRIVLRLRHPDGALMRSVTVQGANWRLFDAQKEIIVFPPKAGTMKVEAYY